MKTIENDWQHLSDPVKTILERADINCKSYKITIGSIVDIPYFQGEMSQEMAEEIVKYQYSKENEGFFAASLENNVLSIEFISHAVPNL